MGIIDFILNLAGLLLWLNWRSNRFDPLVKRLPATLMGTLRPAAPKTLRRWHLLAFIAGLLLLRALIYLWISRQTNWSGKLNLGVTVLWFSGASPWFGLFHLASWMGCFRMVVFSFLSFGLVLGIFYVCLLPLSLLGGPMPIHGLVTIPLGRLDIWPRWARFILPFFVTALLWWLLSGPLTRLGVLAPVALAGRFQQAAVMGLYSYQLWQFPVGALLLLYLFNSYIYFGKYPLWKYVEVTAQKVLRPFKPVPLRLGKVDLAPLIALALLFLIGELAARGLYHLYARLPL